MSSIAVRIPRDTHEKLRQLAKERHETVGQVVSEMVQEAEDQRFWEEFRESVARLKADPDMWREFQEEQRLYDGTLMDGLEPETWPDE